MSISHPRNAKALAIALLTILLGVLAMRCGVIHGTSHCGVLSYIASPIVVVALVVETAIFGVPQPNFMVIALIWAVAFVIAVVLVSVCASVYNRMRR